MSTEPPPVIAYQADTTTVSRWDIAFLGCRLLAIYSVTHALPIVSYFGYIFTPGSFEWGQIATMGMAVAIYIGAALVLWTQAGRLAGFMLADASVAGTTAGPATASLQSIAISMVGLFLAAQAVPRAVMVIGQLLFSSGAQPFYNYEGLVQFALGAALFFGAKGLSHLWYWARTAGTQRADDAPVIPESPDKPQ